MCPVYKENTREFSVLKSDNFGPLICMEVGAMLVGRIVNLHENKRVIRGEEKGFFEYGGSTVVICAEDKRVDINEIYLENSANGVETKVKMGQVIGKKHIDF